MKNSLVILLMLVSVIAKSQEKNWHRVVGGDGNQLIVACKSAMAKIDSSEWEGTKQQAYDAGYCMGLIVGVAENMNSEDSVDLMSDSPSLAQLVRVTEKYLQDHPEQLSKTGSWLIRQAILKSFPVRKAP